MSDLYDTDFVAWAEEQARVIRSLRHVSNALDVDHLAEEVEDLGKAELHACESALEVIFEHLIKSASGVERPQAGWLREIAAARLLLERRLTPSLPNRLNLDRRWRNGGKLARISLAEYGDPIPETPEDCPYTLDELLPDGPEIATLLARLMTPPNT